MPNKPSLVSRMFDVTLNEHKHTKALNVQQVHTTLYILKGGDNFAELTQEQILNKLNAVVRGVCALKNTSTTVFRPDTFNHPQMDIKFNRKLNEFVIVSPKY